MKQAGVNLAQISSWNQPVLNNEGKSACSRKQRELLMGLELVGVDDVSVFEGFLRNTAILANTDLV